MPVTTERRPNVSRGGQLAAAGGVRACTAGPNRLVPPGSALQSTPGRVLGSVTRTGGDHGRWLTVSEYSDETAGSGGEFATSRLLGRWLVLVATPVALGAVLWIHPTAAKTCTSRSRRWPTPGITSTSCCCPVRTARYQPLRPAERIQRASCDDRPDRNRDLSRILPRVRGDRRNRNGDPDQRDADAPGRTTRRRRDGRRRDGHRSDRRRRGPDWHRRLARRGRRDRHLLPAFRRAARSPARSRRRPHHGRRTGAGSPTSSGWRCFWRASSGSSSAGDGSTSGRRRRRCEFRSESAGPVCSSRISSKAWSYRNIQETNSPVHTVELLGPEPFEKLIP